MRSFSFISVTAPVSRQDFEAAETHYLAVAQLLPDNPAALNNVAWVMNRLKKPGAVTVCGKGCRDAPSGPGFLDTLADRGRPGRLEQGRGTRGEGAGSCSRSPRISPQPGQTLSAQGRQGAREGRTSVASGLGDGSGDKLRLRACCGRSETRSDRNWVVGSLYIFSLPRPAFLKKCCNIKDLKRWHPLCLHRCARDPVCSLRSLEHVIILASAVSGSQPARRGRISSPSTSTRTTLGIVGSIGTVTGHRTSTTTATITFQANSGYRFVDGVPRR